MSCEKKTMWAAAPNEMQEICNITQEHRYNVILAAATGMATHH